MRTIFHVGHSKTGSTAIQAAMRASERNLLQRGVLFPTVPDATDNTHKLLFASIFKREQLPRHIKNYFDHEDLPEVSERTARSIRAQIEATMPNCLLLSSESRFRSWSGDQRRRFSAALASAGVGSAEIVAYIRRPASWYLSNLQQTLRASHEIKQPRTLRVFSAVEQFTADSGRSNVTLRAFDRRCLLGGDVVADFVGHMLAPHGVTSQDIVSLPDANVSLTSESVDLMRRYRRQFHPTQADRHLPESQALQRTLRQIEPMLQLPRPSMDPELAERIDYSHDDLLRLRDGYGLELPDYDYARLERGELAILPQEPLTLDQILRIDREAQARVIERLRETRWAEADPARRHWLDALPGEIEAERREAAGAAARGVVASEKTTKSNGWAHTGKPAGPGLDDWPEAFAIHRGEPVLPLGGALAARMGLALKRAGLDLAAEEPLVAMPTATLLAKWAGWAADGHVPDDRMRDRQVSRIRHVLARAFGRAGAPTEPAGARAQHVTQAKALADAVRRARAAVVELETTWPWLDSDGGGLPDPACAEPHAERRSVEDVASALREAMRSLRSLNPELRVILCMRPAPKRISAADGNEHIAAEDDATRRAAMGEVVASVDDVTYLPLFEALTTRRIGTGTDSNGSGDDGLDRLAEAIALAIAAPSPRGQSVRHARGG